MHPRIPSDRLRRLVQRRDGRRATPRRRRQPTRAWTRSFRLSGDPAYEAATRTDGARSPRHCQVHGRHRPSWRRRVTPPNPKDRSRLSARRQQARPRSVRRRPARGTGAHRVEDPGAQPRSDDDVGEQRGTGCPIQLPLRISFAMLSSGKARRIPACTGSSSGSTELARSIGPASDSATRDLAARICSFQSRLARDAFPQRGIENERLPANCSSAVPASFLGFDELLREVDERGLIAGNVV